MTPRDELAAALDAFRSDDYSPLDLWIEDYGGAVLALIDAATYSATDPAAISTNVAPLISPPQPEGDT